MSKTIELPDPLFAEIKDYAARARASPLDVLQQAWGEFTRRRAMEGSVLPAHPPSVEEKLAAVRALVGSLKLPADKDDRTLIEEARHEALLERYGPF